MGIKIMKLLHVITLTIYLNTLMTHAFDAVTPTYYLFAPMYYTASYILIQQGRSDLNKSNEAHAITELSMNIKEGSGGEDLQSQLPLRYHIYRDTPAYRAKEKKRQSNVSFTFAAICGITALYRTNEIVTSYIYSTHND